MTFDVASVTSRLTSLGYEVREADSASLAFCVEKLVVHAQVGCAEGRIGGDVTANTHSPVVILVPIGFLGGTDIAHGSFVGSSQECLGKAFALLETS